MSLYWLMGPPAKCACGASADPDWGQCFDCFSADRAVEDREADHYYADMGRRYEEDMRAQYEASFADAPQAPSTALPVGAGRTGNEPDYEGSDLEDAPAEEER